MYVWPYTTYKLFLWTLSYWQIIELASGKISDGVSTGAALTPEDCLYIAQTRLDRSPPLINIPQLAIPEHALAIEWLEAGYEYNNAHKLTNA